MANKDSSRVSFSNRRDIKVKIPFKKIKTNIQKNQKQKSTRSLFGNKKRSHNNTQRALLHASHATKKKNWIHETTTKTESKRQEHEVYGKKSRSVKRTSTVSTVN